MGWWGLRVIRSMVNGEEFFILIIKAASDTQLTTDQVKVMFINEFI